MLRTVLLSTIAIATFAGSASAAGPELIKNGGFETTTMTRSQQIVGEVSDWTNEVKPKQHSGMGYNFLIKPNTADTTGFYSIADNHDYLYGPGQGVGAGNYSANGFTGVSPTGGNFLLLDGDTNFHGTISQLVTGLVAGSNYALTFDWAGASWYTTPGLTTERFDVTFGGKTQATETVKLDDKGFSGWKSAKMIFTAGGASETLSFLAQGTPNGLPPSLLLDNVSLTAVPEASTWAMMLVGVGGMGAALRRRRSARTALAAA